MMLLYALLFSALGILCYLGYKLFGDTNSDSIDITRFPKKFDAASKVRTCQVGRNESNTV